MDAQVLCKENMTGVGYYAHNMVKALSSLDHDFLLQLTAFDFLGRHRTKQFLEEKFGGPNVTASVYPYMPHGAFLRAHTLARLFVDWEQLGNSKPDVCHFFNYFVPEGIKSRVITTVHDMVYKKMPHTMSKVNREFNRRHLERSIRRADAIVTVSESAKQDIIEEMNIPASRIIVTHNAVDKEIYKPVPDRVGQVREKYGLHRDFILYLGTLEPRKNVERLIRAYKILHDRGVGVDLVLAGIMGWGCEHLPGLVVSLGIADSVKFLGYIPESDKPALYSAARLFAFVSLYEGFGIPPLEALACGTPVVVSDIPAMREVVSSHGIVVDPYSFETIAEGLKQGIKKSLDEHSLGPDKAFAWANSANGILDVYNSLS